MGGHRQPGRGGRFGGDAAVVRAVILGALLLILSHCNPLSAAEGTEHAPDPINDMSDLNGRRVGVLVGTILDEVAEKSIDYVSIEYYDDYESMEKDVLSGKIDALFGDGPVVRARAADNPRLKVLDGMLEPNFYGFAFNKRDRALRNSVDALIREYLADGTVSRLVDKWTTGPEQDRKAPRLSRDSTGNALRMGVSGVLPPFSYLDGQGNAIGVDIEIADMIAKRLNRPLEVVVMDFAQLIPTLLSGKVDMIGGSVTITPERSAIIDFTRGYYSIGVAALVVNDR